MVFCGRKHLSAPAVGCRRHSEQDCHSAALSGGKKFSESFGFCHNSPSRMVESMMDGERSALPMQWMNDDNCHGHSNNQLSLHTALTFFADNGVWVLPTSSFIEKKLAPSKFFETPLIWFNDTSTRWASVPLTHWLPFFNCLCAEDDVLSSVYFLLGDEKW